MTRSRHPFPTSPRRRSRGPSGRNLRRLSPIVLAVAALPAFGLGGTGGPAMLANTGALLSAAGAGGDDSTGGVGVSSAAGPEGGGGGGGGAADPLTGLGLAGGAGGTSITGNGAAGGAGGNPLIQQTGGDITLDLLGGRGINGSLASGRGGGGGGGQGGPAVFLILDGGPTSQVQSNLTGGFGGNGGDSPSYGGNGGGGGAALWVRGAGTATLGAGAVLTGGRGGPNGNLGVNTNGKGGDGGPGIRIGDTAVVTNLGRITGGDTGQSGFPNNVAGGDGAYLTGGRLINFGVVSSGRNLQLPGTPVNLSIRFRSGSAVFDAMPGSSLVGSVLVDPGATGTLRLLGSSLDAPYSLITQGRAIVETSAGNISMGATIVGPGSFEKTGGDQLVVAASNTYSGGTRVSGGTLTGGVNSFGSGAIVDNAVLDIRQDTDATLVNAVSGSGVLRKSGTGVLTLSPSTNSYSGGTQIAQGTLRGQSTSFGSGPITNDAQLVLDEAAAATLANPIAGTGVLVKEGAGVLRLANAGNSYSGGTVINAGGMVGPAGAFGSGTVTNNAQLVFDEGASGTVPGAIRGAGSVTKTGAGSVTLAGDSDFSAGLSIKAGRVDLARNTAAGTGPLSMDDGTTLGFAADNLRVANDIRLTGTNDPTIDTGARTATLSGVISGAADLTKVGSGTLVLEGRSSHSGATNVAAGSLRAGAANVLSPASAHRVAAGATLDLAGFAQTLPSLDNAGTVSLAGGTAGNTLTLANGAWVGRGGLLRLAAVLGPTGSASDRLVLDGPLASASGSTAVQVVNLAGLGALTTGDGIEVVSARNGATSTAQSTRNAFALAGNVAAGAFDYQLKAGDASGAGENWYLRSTTQTPVVVPTPDGGSTVVTAELPSYRPEATLVSVMPQQLSQSDLGFADAMRSRGRLAARPDADRLRTDCAPEGERTAWANVVSLRPSIEQGGTVSPRSEGRLHGLQVGSDLLTMQCRWRAGVYVGQLEGRSSADGFVRGLPGSAAGSNDLRSQYAGGYLDWTGDGGWFGDAVLQWGTHHYTVEPLGLLPASGKSSSWLASIRAGRQFDLGSGWRIEPDLHLGWVHGADVDLALGATRVRSEGDRGFVVGAGVRLEGRFDANDQRWLPYLRASLDHRTRRDNATTFTSPAAIDTLQTKSGGSSLDAALGVRWQINDRTDLLAEAGRRTSLGGGSKVASGLQASVGLQVRW